ncbi:HAD family hydrolase [Patescibacteria group bacterium]
MTIVFDLDYTLLNTLRFEEELAKALTLDFEEYRQSSKKYFDVQGINYNAYKHIGFLLHDDKLTKQQNSVIKNNILTLLKSTNDYLFGEAEDLLKNIKEAGHKIILLTLGDPVWQGMKINYLKINKYFDKIMLTDKDKEKVIDFLKNEKERVILVNDNAQESLKIKKVLGNIRIILIKGPHSKNIKHNLKIHELKNVWEEIQHGN